MDKELEQLLTALLLVAWAQAGIEPGPLGFEVYALAIALWPLCSSVTLCAWPAPRLAVNPVLGAGLPSINPALGAGLPSVNPVLGAGLPSVNPVLGAGLPSVSAGLFPVSPGFPASNLGSNAKGRMGKIKLFPTTEYTSKQASDPVVPLVPCTGIFLGPSKSSKTVALISLILEQYRGVFERIYIFSPSVNIDDGWIPVKKYIEEDLGVNPEREQTYGRGGAAAHHPAAAQDHGGVQEVGNEETVPGACSHRRLC